MKVLHLSSASGWRGGEQQIAYLIEELPNYGVESVLLCPMDSALAEKDLQDLTLKIRYQKRGSIDLFVSRTLKQITTTENIDLIHVHDPHAHNYAWAASRFWRMKTPVIVTQRMDINMKNVSIRRFNHASIKRIICISAFLQKQIQGVVKDPERVLKIYSGIDVNKFNFQKSEYFKKTFKIPDECLIFGSIAPIAVQKDFLSFVELAKLYRQNGNPDARFLIIGADAGQEKKVKKLVRQYDLGNHVIFTGFQEDIEKKIFELDVMISTSQMEGLGTSVLDAFAARIPVISTNAGGLAETVIHEKTALVSEVGDVAGMYQNLKRLISDETLKESLVNQSFEFVKNFDKKKTKKKIFKVYEEVLMESLIKE